jgi:hypothetical protein
VTTVVDRLAAGRSSPAAVAWGPLAAVASSVLLLLVVTSAGYGYHRDEMYFLQAGRHLAWGYPDQPPLVPLVARTVSAVSPDSLVALRLPAALAAALVVLLTGLIARELGGGRAAQLLAAACVAVSALLLAVGHTLGTSVFDLLAWTTVSWLVVRLLRGADQREWLLAGLVAGVGLLNKSLLAFLLLGLLAGVLAVGPRDVLRSRWLWLGAVLASVIWLPDLIWQGQHGWPQLDLSRAIASGSSGSSQPPALFVPFQLVLISPVLVPVWLAGLIRLAREPGLARVRAFAVAYGFLLVVFLLTGGKPYYLGGLYPVLLAAGAVPTIRWLERGRPRARRALLTGALALSAAVSIVLMLPVVPVSVLPSTPIVAVNYDAGETVGWPRFAATVARVYDALPPAERRRAVLLTDNYGEAGALDRFGPALGLPPAYSGHNGYGEWGPPPQTGGPVIAVGISRPRLEQLFATVQPSARIDNGVGVDNQEQGETVWTCRHQRQPWSRTWRQLRHLS